MTRYPIEVEELRRGAPLRAPCYGGHGGPPYETKASPTQQFFVGELVIGAYLMFGY